MAVAEGLSRHGVVTAIDLPGFGYSPPGRSYRLGAHKAAVEWYLESLPEPALLIGNSLGGLIAELVAADRPDLVSGLVAVSPATSIPPGRPQLDWEIATRLLIQALPLVGAAYLRSYHRRTTPRQQVADTMAVVTYRPTAVPPEVLDATLPLAALRRATYWSIPALVQSGRAAGRYLARRRRFVDMIEQIKVPTLVVQGVHDRIIAPGSIRWLGRLRPDWRVETMAETGHCPQLDAPHEFVALFEDWLAGWDQKAQPGLG
jgi:pimeloyl-ACP methyl ester carboxylesterase